jgi:transposase
MEIMHTMASEAIAQRRKRRYYSPELKTQVVAQCQVSGASVAGVALAHGINANIVHRWLREQTVQQMPAARNEFMALALKPAAMQQPAPAPASKPANPSSDIRVEVWRSAGTVTVNWPLEDAASCAAWLREWLK